MFADRAAAILAQCALHKLIFETMLDHLSLLSIDDWQRCSAIPALAYKTGPWLTSLSASSLRPDAHTLATVIATSYSYNYSYEVR